jgi:hypothetical protein
VIQNKLFIGYEFKGILRLIAFFFILFGFVLFISVLGKSETMAVSFVLIISGFYVFSLHTFIEINETHFRIVTCSFYLFDSGAWKHKSNYPYTSFKTVHKTYELPRIGQRYIPGTFITDHDFRVVLTDEFQTRFLNLKDFKTLKEATDFINEVNRFMGTEFALWGSRMRK